MTNALTEGFVTIILESANAFQGEEVGTMTTFRFFRYVDTRTHIKSSFSFSCIKYWFTAVV